jgi:hypothetical protein
VAAPHLYSMSSKRLCTLLLLIVSCRCVSCSIYAALQLQTITVIKQATAERKRKVPSATADTTSDDRGSTAAERVRYNPARTLTAVSDALLEAGASPQEVDQCMAALPQASPAPASVPATLLLAFAAYWLLTTALGLGDHSAVYAMVGLIPLVLNMPHIVVAVYCMHFPVDKQHMMAAGSGIVWRMKNLAARFIGADNKIINTVCCTGHFLLLLLEHLPYTFKPITDIHPFVNTARGGGYHSSDAAHRQALLSMLNLWLSNCWGYWTPWLASCSTAASTTTFWLMWEATLLGCMSLPASSALMVVLLQCLSLAHNTYQCSASPGLACLSSTLRYVRL